MTARSGFGCTSLKPFLQTLLSVGDSDLILMLLLSLAEWKKKPPRRTWP